jgi:hypothetical protein
LIIIFLAVFISTTSTKFLGFVVYSSCFSDEAAESLFLLLGMTYLRFTSFCSEVFSLPTVFIGHALVSGASLLPQLSIFSSLLPTVFVEGSFSFCKRSLSFDMISGKGCKDSFHRSLCSEMVSMTK